MQVETIRSWVQRGAAHHPELAGRLERAAFIILFREVSPEFDGTWRVGSERDPPTSYRVQLDARQIPAESAVRPQCCVDHFGRRARFSLRAGQSGGVGLSER